MAKTRYFYDGEMDEVYTLEQLREIYEDEKAHEFYGDTFMTDSFENWLRNATDKNGSLTEITHNTLDSYLQRFDSFGLPVVAYDWFSERQMWWFENDTIIVVKEDADQLYDVKGNPIAHIVYCIRCR